ncbi:protease SohB [Legionella sp. W05-934-2]|uniref:protease SohB n=1 Tax=Legionella sp. W05-934-2 TaxID=1198649 RepID=UPI003462E19C
MAFLAEYGMFALKLLTIIIGILILLAGIISISKKSQPKVSLESLSDEFESLKTSLNKVVKPHVKQSRKELKAKHKAQKELPSIFVIDFDGDIKASQTEQLRKAVTAILAVATEKDQVVIRLNSPGGAVNGYGLAASQLQRIRDKQIPLVACIDKIAASGGYLMACVANQIMAAPFAIIGSIGVVAQLPNFHRWLKKHDIDFELLTAGEFKRTLTVFGENTAKGREKFQEDIELIHQAFRNYVMQNRQMINIDEVATGEHWLALDAYQYRLIDVLKTSDDYLISQMSDYNIYRVKVHSSPALMEKLMKPVAKMLHPWS